MTKIKVQTAATVLSFRLEWWYSGHFRGARPHLAGCRCSSNAASGGSAASGLDRKCESPLRGSTIHDASQPGTTMERSWTAEEIAPTLLPQIPIYDVGPNFPMELALRVGERAYDLLAMATAHVPRPVLRLADRL